MSEGHLIEITSLSKTGGPLTKRISLTKDGTLRSDGSACVMSRGRASRARFPDLATFAAHIGGLKSHEGVSLGTLRVDLPETVSIITAEKLAQLNGSAAIDVISRTAGQIEYRPGVTALALIDVDTKGMPSAVRERIEAAGGFWPALISVLPELETAGRVTRRSTTTGISRTDTGDALPGSNGLHIYVLVADGGDVERVLKVLDRRCWLGGFGWMMVGASGSFLERSLIDRMVCAAERIVFEGAPVLGPRLLQDQISRAPVVAEGLALDTRGACHDLTSTEESKLRELLDLDRKRVQPEAARVRAEYIRTQAAVLVKRTGCTPEVARQTIERRCDGVLLAGDVLPFDAREFEGVTVAEVLADPERFVGATLADPQEGPDYGRGKAKIMRRPDGTLLVHSFAHGGLTYELGDAPPAVEPQNAVAALIEEFNARYMVVNEAGRAIIYEPAHDPMLNRRYYTRITFEDFKKLYLNRHVQIGEDRVKAANVWLASGNRRQFLGGVAFDPSGKHVPADALNLWRGFAVKPKKGSWRRMREHILRVLCGRNKEQFKYLMQWMARLVQHPAEQGEVAVIMRGGEGTGKGTLAKALLRILGQHGLAVSNSKHLTGNFNGHLRDTVLLFADEAFFAGDRAHVGVLKSLITEPFLTIEAKYQNAVQMPNFVHLMMASNEEWVVPASLDARRFFVLEVSSAQANDHAYFGAIWQEMEAGGYEAMLHDLLAIDLTFANVRRVPATEGLHQQRKLSLGTSEAWWFEVLHRGYVFKSRLGLEFFDDWHDVMTTEVLYASYEAFAKERHERHLMSREAFGRFLREIAKAKPEKQRNAVIGERFADVENIHGGTSRKAELARHPRKPGYKLGTLEVARAAFVIKTGLTGAWPDDEA